MPKFAYKGETKEGEKVTITVEADDRYAVYDIARQNGHTVSEVSEAKGFSFGRLTSMDKINVMLSRISADTLVLLTRNLASMLRAGLPLTRALSVLERQSKNPRVKKTFIEIREHINKGGQFYEALALYPRVFSNLYIAMVKAGEESGQLSEALQTLAIQMERSSNLKKKIKGAMIYPAIVITVMVIIGILMMIFVVPAITATFRSLGADLPTTTKVLIGTSDFLSNNSVVALGLLIGLIVGFIYALRTNWGKRIFHYIIVRLPVIGNLVKETNSARTARTLSSLLESGVDVISAISITEEVVQNVYYKDILRGAAARVEKGTPLSEIFIAETKLYPVLVGEMIAVGEETGQISKMLGEMAIYYETEVEQKTKDLSTIIEPVLMVFIGATVGFFALAMIAPIYSISDSIA